MVRCLSKMEPEELIDAALENRRSVWLDKVNPVSTENYFRLGSEDPNHRLERKSFFEKLNAKDPSFMAGLGQDMDDLFPQNFEPEEPVAEVGKPSTLTHL